MKLEAVIKTFFGTSLNGLGIIAPPLAGRLGFRLFCTPFSPPLSEAHRTFLEESKWKQFESNGIKLQSYRWGQGPQHVLLVHGWRSSTYRWKQYVDNFDLNKFTLYAFDGPGHGLSEGKILNVPLFAEAIHQFVANNVKIDSIVSHSLGSFASIYMLHQSSHIPIKQLVILGSPGRASDFIDVFKEQLGLHPRVVRSVENYFVKLYQHDPSYFDTTRFLPNIDSSGLIVHDENDEVVPVSDAKANHHNWSNSTLTITNGYGHRLRSRKVVEMVDQYLQGVYVD